MNNTNTILKLSRTREYRGMTPIDKAVKILSENKFSLREVVRMMEVPQTNLFRAKKAAANNKGVGVVGRPKVLGEEGEQ